MKLNTRHYVKRQLTWFRRDKRLNMDRYQSRPDRSVAVMIAGHYIREYIMKEKIILAVVVEHAHSSGLLRMRPLR